MAEGQVPKQEDADLHLEAVDSGGKGLEGGVFIENRAEKEKKLVRKIDSRMMPLMMVLCG